MTGCVIDSCFKMVFVSVMVGSIVLAQIQRKKIPTRLADDDFITDCNMP